MQRLSFGLYAKLCCKRKVLLILPTTHIYRLFLLFDWQLRADMQKGHHKCAHDGDCTSQTTLKYLRDWRPAVLGHVPLIAALCEPQQLTA